MPPLMPMVAALLIESVCDFVYQITVFNDVNVKDFRHRCLCPSLRVMLHALICYTCDKKLFRVIDLYTFFYDSVGLYETNTRLLMCRKTKYRDFRSVNYHLLEKDIQSKEGDRRLEHNHKSVKLL